MKIAIDRAEVDRVVKQLDRATRRAGPAARLAVREACALLWHQAENRDLLASASYAATCIYCGEAVIYDTREEADMQAAHQRLVDHDQHCPRNPLVARVAELQAQVERLSAPRPENCRNELQAQGKSYPRSGCAVCGNGGLAGCPYEAPRAHMPSTHSEVES